MQWVLASSTIWSVKACRTAVRASPAVTQESFMSWKPLISSGLSIKWSRWPYPRWLWSLRSARTSQVLPDLVESLAISPPVMSDGCLTLFSDKSLGVIVNGRPVDKAVDAMWGDCFDFHFHFFLHCIVRKMWELCKRASTRSARSSSGGFLLSTLAPKILILSVSIAWKGLGVSSRSIRDDRTRTSICD